MREIEKGETDKTILLQAFCALCGIGERLWHLGCFIDFRRRGQGVMDRPPECPNLL